MVASFTRGTTFVNGQMVDSQDLLDLVKLAAVAGIDRTNRASDEPAFFVTVDTSPPAGQASLESWYNSNSGWWQTITAAAVPASVLPGGMPVTITGEAVVSGQALYPVSYDGTTLTMSLVKAGIHTWRALAVAAQNIAVGASGIAIFSGPCRIKSSGTIEAGQALQVSTTEDGVVIPIAARGLGLGPKGFAIATRAASGGYVWSLLWK